MKRSTQQGSRRIVEAALSRPSEDWLRVLPDPGFDREAPVVAEGFATTRAGRELLTRALIALNREALGRNGTVAQIYAWVPDRAVGEVKIFVHQGIRALASPAEATPEAFAARDVQKDVGRKFKIIDHDAVIFEPPAGRAVAVIRHQLERRNAFATNNIDVLIFPPVPDLSEAFILTFFTDDFELGEQMAVFARNFAESVELTVE